MRSRQNQAATSTSAATEAKAASATATAAAAAGAGAGANRIDSLTLSSLLESVFPTNGDRSLAAGRKWLQVQERKKEMYFSQQKSKEKRVGCGFESNELHLRVKNMLKFYSHFLKLIEVGACLLY